MSVSDTRWHRASLWFLAITTLLRLALLPRLELAPDEAYYWDWSRHLALGYYDQGPLIAYLIRLTTAVFGTNEFGVRVGVCLASLGTIVCCYVLARRLFSPLAGFLTVLLLGATPLMTVGSLIATYDPPLVFFWALTVLFLERVSGVGCRVSETAELSRSDFSANEAGPLTFAKGKSVPDPRPPTPDTLPATLNWLGAGVAAGLGFLSKHTMLLILPCLILFLLLSPRHRFWLRRPQPYLAFLLTLLLYSGVFYWNALHHGWTFGHLLFLAKKDSHTPIQRFGDFLGSQALLLGPVLFVGLLGLFYREQGVFVRERDEKRLFLLCMGLPVFLFFCLLTLKAKVQGNWAPCAWLTPTVLWAGLLAEVWERKRKAKRWLVGAIATSGLLTLLILSPGLRYRLGLHLPPEGDLSNTVTGWRETARHVQDIRDAGARAGRTTFLAANDYQYAAEMAFYLPDHPETHDLFLHFRLNMYAAYVERLKTHLGEDAIFINENELEDGYLRQVFAGVAWEPPYPIWRKPFYSEPIRTVHIARCRRYRRYTGLDWAEGG